MRPHGRNPFAVAAVALFLVVMWAPPLRAARHHPAPRPLLDCGRLPSLVAGEGGEGQPVALRHTHVEAEVSGFVARVTVTQTYESDAPEPIEAVYTFPLPENAAVHGLRMVVGERVIEAEVQRRAEARETYEAARDGGRVAALLEQERPNLFTHSLANLQPLEPIEVVVTYVQPLAYDDGWYELSVPTVVGPRFVPPDGSVPDADRVRPAVSWRPGHDLSIDVVVAPDLPVLDLDVPTHEVDVVEADGATLLSLSEGAVLPDRDFVARFRVDRAAPHGAVLTHRAGAGPGYVSLVVLPPRPPDGALVPDWEVVFVVDVSGSMTGAPLEAAKAAVVDALGRLRPTDTFNVYTFAGNTSRLFAGPRHATAENLTTALAFVDAATAGGGTFLDAAVQEALSPAPAPQRQRAVVFLTDGYVGGDDTIIGAAGVLVAAHEAAGARARVFGVGIGAAPNRNLIEGLSAAGRGVAGYLLPGQPTAPVVTALYRRLDEPVLADVRVDWGDLGVRDAEPAPVPDLYAGRPVVLHARYDRPGRGTVTVSGTMGGARVAVSVDVVLPEAAAQNEVLPALWARARVAALSQAVREGRLSEDQGVRRATRVALAHGIVSPWTSLIAVDRSRRVGAGQPLMVRVPAAPVAGMAPGETGAGYGSGCAGGSGRLRLHDTVQKVVVTSADVDIRGGLDKDVIQRRFRDHQSELRWCYTEALRRDRSLRGRLVLDLVIIAGKVILARAAEDDLGDPELAACVVRRVSTWRFPDPPDEGAVRVRYPLRFEPKDGAGPLFRPSGGAARR